MDINHGRYKEENLPIYMRFILYNISLFLEKVEHTGGLTNESVDVSEY